MKNNPDHLFDSIAVNSPGNLAEAISEGADVNARDSRGCTPLHHAYDRPSLVNSLLQAGADPNLSDNNGRTPLHSAVSDPETDRSDRRDVLTALLDAGADPNVSDHRGQTPLHDAVTLPREIASALRQLLDAGADPAARDELGNLPLHYAAAHIAKGRADAVDQLLNAANGANAPNNSGKTPLHWAAARPGQDQAQIITRLLDAAADPTARDNLGNLPLHYAAASAGETRPDAVSLLLRSRLGVNAQNNSGNTPLHNAVLHPGEGQAKTIAELLDAGGDPTLTNPRGQSPLDLAASLKNPVAQTIVEQRTTQAERYKLRPDHPKPAPSTTTPAERLHVKANAYHRTVAACLIRQIRQGTAPWQKFRQPGEPFLPQNLATGREYKGGNSLYLMAVARDNGYSDPRWSTYKQIKAAGGVVRKGEKPTKIVWWDFSKAKDKVPLTDREGNPVLADKGQPFLHHQGPRFRLYSVFNVEQAHNLKLEPLAQKPDWQAHRDADALIKASGVKIKHITPVWNYYNPKTDTITLASPHHLRNPESYYHLANHELAHATSHPSRLNRSTYQDGREAGPYSLPNASEELRAEIAAMMTNSRLGLGHSSVEGGTDTAAWSKLLSDNPMEFHFAARDAQRISDHLIHPIRDRLQQKEPQPGQEQRPDADRATPAPAAPSLSARMSAYRQSIPADHVELEARPTTDLPNGPIAYKYEGHPMPQDLKGLTKEDFGYNQVIAHAPQAEVQNNLRSLPEPQRPTIETGPGR